MQIMKDIQKKAHVSKHYDISFDPWLLYPTGHSKQKIPVPMKMAEEKITLGFPDDGQNAIIDDFVFTTLPNPQLPIDVAKIGSSNWFPGTSLERPVGYAQSIEFVVAGKGELIINDRKFDLEKNDIYILHNTESYVYKALPPDRFKRIILFFNGSNAEQIFRMTGLDKVSRVRMPQEEAEHIHELIIQIDEINRSRRENFMLKVSSLTYELILLLSNEMYEHSAMRDVPDYLIRTVEFAMKNLGANLHVTDLAKAACCSESYLTKIFKQNLNMNPHQWLEVQKMKFAAVRLQLSRMKVYEIADELGYSDTFHFTRVFKRVVGISPSIFRVKSKKTLLDSR